MTVQIPSQTDSPAQPRLTFWDLAGFDGGDRFNSPKSASNGSSVSFPTWESVETDLPNEDAIPVKKFPRLAEMISDIWSEISQISNQLQQSSCNLGCFCSPIAFFSRFRLNLTTTGGQLQV